MSAFFGSVRMRTKSASRERRQLDADRQAPLKFRNQVGRLGDVERARGDEKNMVGADHAVARIDRGALDDRQDVALHAFARDVRTVTGFAAGDLVDLIDEDDAHLFGALDGQPRDLLHVDQLVFFFLDQVIDGFGDRHLAALLLLAEQPREHVLDVDVHFLDALIGDDFKRGHRALANFHFHQALIEFAVPKLRAELFPRAVGLIAAI